MRFQEGRSVVLMSVPSHAGDGGRPVLPSTGKPVKPGGAQVKRRPGSHDERVSRSGKRASYCVECCSSPGLGKQLRDLASEEEAPGDPAKLVKSF